MSRLAGLIRGTGVPPVFSGRKPQPGRRRTAVPRKTHTLSAQGDGLKLSTCFRIEHGITSRELYGSGVYQHAATGLGGTLDRELDDLQPRTTSGISGRLAGSRAHNP